ncbi:chromogranin-A isoform X2 [Rhinoraja longicauda]
MIALILFTLLLARQASSSPVPKEPSKADAKIMNCVVEVISDTLSKPSPLPISQECMEALKGDERIISMLRHQNLLREFQELAAEDNTENNPTEQHRSSAEKVETEEEIRKERQPAVRRHRIMNLVDTTEDSSSIINVRDGETARKVPIGDEPFNSRSSESESDVGPSQDQRQSEEHGTEAHEDEYTEQVGEDHIKESSEEDEEETHNPNEDSKDEELIYPEEPSQEDWGDDATNSDSSEVKDNGKGSDEEMRSNENSERHQNSENVEEEYSSKNNGKDELSEEGEGKQKMEELAPKKKLRKHEASGEDKLIRFENVTPQGRHGHFQQVQGSRRSDPEEDRQNKMAITSSALQKQLDVEDKKEEEGSATRKNEEQEVESLEEIESELEAMARRLHEMRSS